MPEKKTRLNLQELFASGKIPTESDFADLFASGINQLDDGVSVGEFGNIGIGTDEPSAKLDVKGAANIWAGARYAVPNGNMAPGSLTIGNTGADFGGGKSWNANTAGLLLETKDNTEIAVHDGGKRMTSLMYYEGANANRITIGRDMGWGSPTTLSINSNVGVGTPDIYNPQGWNKVLDILGTQHARLNVRSSGGVVTSVFSHDNWQGAKGVIGTESNHPLVFATGYQHRMTIGADGNVGIGTNDPKAKLDVQGAANIWAGNRYAVPQGKMTPGSLTIGNGNTDFGGGEGWNSNIAALLFEAKSNTEIAVHDWGTRIASLMYYEGDNENRLTIGRDMGWGPLDTLDVRAKLIRRISIATGLGPNDGTDNGQIKSRVLKIKKNRDGTAIRILYCDNLRVNGINAAARWEIRVDGKSVPGGAIYQDKYGNAGNYHSPATITGYAVGIKAGSREISIWVRTLPGFSNDAYTGWNESRWTIEAEEVWI